VRISPDIQPLCPVIGCSPQSGTTQRRKRVVQVRKLVSMLLLLVGFWLCSLPGCTAGIGLYLGTTPILDLPPPVVSEKGLLVPVELARQAGADLLAVSAITVRFRIAGCEVEVRAGESTALIDGIGQPMPAAAITRQNTLYAPLSFLAQVLHHDVSWDQANSIVRLTPAATSARVSPPSSGVAQPQAVRPTEDRSYRVEVPQLQRPAPQPQPVVGAAVPKAARPVAQPLDSAEKVGPAVAQNPVVGEKVEPAVAPAPEAGKNAQSAVASSPADRAKVAPPVLQRPVVEKNPDLAVAQTPNGQEHAEPTVEAVVDEKAELTVAQPQELGEAPTPAVALSREVSETPAPAAMQPQEVGEVPTPVIVGPQEVGEMPMPAIGQSQEVGEEEQLTFSWQFPGNNDTSLLVEMAFEHGAPVITLENVPTASVEVSLVSAPHRLVIDIESFIPAADAAPWILNQHNLIKARIGLFKGKARLVFEMQELVGYAVESVGTGTCIRLNRVLRQVDFQPSPLGGLLNLDVAAGTPYEITLLPEPERLVIDIPSTTLIGGARHLLSEEGPIKALRVSQFTSTMVRVVLDLDGPLPDIYALPGKTLQLIWGSEVRNVGTVLLDGKQLIVIEGVGALSGRLLRLRSPDRVVLDLPQTFARRQFGPVNAQTGVLAALRAAQFDSTTFRIVAEVPASTHATVIRLAADAVGILLETPTLAECRIVVDPGHGGFDPGAIGVTGLQEKDVNLDIALRLSEMLLAAKAKVSATRTSDTHVFLTERSLFTSRIEPDVFVSVHANSINLSADSAFMPAGTETYFWHVDNGSMELARLIQEELVLALGSVDRGVKRKSLHVLRETSVSAALVEVGFLSSPEEEQLLADPAYRQRAAEGIFQGILRYLRPQREDAPPMEEIAALWSQAQQTPRFYLPAISEPEPVNKESQAVTGEGQSTSSAELTADRAGETHPAA
jgi:N-acetylmuramoyl-L-alanine amidase